MFKTDLTGQPSLFAFTPRDLLADDSDVWLYCDLFDQISLDLFCADYSSQGEEGLDPTLMLRTIFYGLTHGAVSGRKLEAACRFDARYMVLAGAHKPNFRTFHRFLVRHEARLGGLFGQVVRLAMEMNLVRLGKLAIDGTRIRAYTSQQRTMKHEKMQLAITKIESELAELKRQTELENREESTVAECTLPDEIKRREARLESIRRAKDAIEDEAAERKREPKATTQRSFNDVDAIAMGIGKGGFLMGYNGQAIADDESQVIVAADIFQSTNDAPLLASMLGQIAENGIESSKVQSVLADSGYLSAENLRIVAATGAEPVFANKKEQGCASQTGGGVTKYEQISADSTTNTYKCLAGKALPSAGRRRDDGLYVAISDEFCQSCAFQETCRLYPNRNQSRIGMALPDDWMVLRDHYQRSRSEAFKEAYKQRKAIIEPVFGNIKYNKSLSPRVTGLARVAGWWKMVCTAHNIEKIIRHMAQPMSVLPT